MGGDSNIRADLKDSYGETPLSWAARRGHELGSDFGNSIVICVDSFVVDCLY